MSLVAPSLFRLRLDAASNRIFSPLLREKILRMRPHNPLWLRSWEHATKRLLPLGGASEGNKIQYFNSGTEGIVAQWDAIDNAQKNINIEIYTLAPDTVGMETIAKLAAASRRGVNVTALLDEGGSLGTSVWHEHKLDPLYAAGTRVVWYNRMHRNKWYKVASNLVTSWSKSHKLFTSMMYRNHRKSLVVDDKTAFVGSANFGNDYANASIGGNGLFRDTLCRLEGPAVADIRGLFAQTLSDARATFLFPHSDGSRFAEDSLPHPPAVVASRRPLFRYFRQVIPERWRGRHAQLAAMFGHGHGEAAGNSELVVPEESPHGVIVPDTSLSAVDHASLGHSPHHIMASDSEHVLDCHEFAPAEEADGSFVQILTSGRGKRSISRALEATINSAKYSIFITNPYFFPRRKIRHALARATDRGVDVRVITCGKSDLFGARWAARRPHEWLMKRGVSVFELQDQVLHAKTIIIDGVYSSIGSYNFDDWSDWRNLETNVSSLCPDHAQTLHNHFESDLNNSKELTLKELESRGVFSRSLHNFAFYASRFPNWVENWDTLNEHLDVD
eukprot:47268_1